MGLNPRMVLKRSDGTTYLTRWGISTRFGGLFVHRMDSGDPGIDLHDHPWPFVSFIPWGWYIELTCPTDEAVMTAQFARRFSSGPTKFFEFKDSISRGKPVRRKWFNVMTKKKCHRVAVVVPGTYTIVLHGPRRRDRKGERSTWGFYTPDGWVDELTHAERYDHDLVRVAGRVDR